MKFASSAAAVLAAALSTVSIVAPAQAQDAKAGRRDMAGELQKRFAAADKNGDGKLTKEEAQAGMSSALSRLTFDSILRTRPRSSQTSVLVASLRVSVTN